MFGESLVQPILITQKKASQIGVGVFRMVFVSWRESLCLLRWGILIKTIYLFIHELIGVRGIFK